MNARRKVGTILAGALLAATSFGGYQTASAGGGEAAVGAIVQNGTFTSGVEGWALSSNAKLQKLAGIGQLVNTQVGGATTHATATQCVDLNGTSEYRIQARMWATSNLKREGEVSLRVTTYGGHDCTSSLLKSYTVASSDAAAWVEVNELLAHDGAVPKSVRVKLVTTKFGTAVEANKAYAYSGWFDDISLTAVPKQGGGEVSCIAFAGACGEDEEPGGMPSCTDECPDDDSPVPPPAAPTSDEPVPADAPADPAPAGPAIPGGEPAPIDNDDEPVDAGDKPTSGETPAAPADNSGSDSPTTNDTPTTNSGSTGQPSGNGAPTQQGSGGPAKPAKPTLEPQGPGPINAGTPTPGAPATGGDSSDDPSDSLTGGRGESDQAVGLDGANDGDEPASALPLMLAGGLGAIGLGLILAFAFRRRSHR